MQRDDYIYLFVFFLCFIISVTVSIYAIIPLAIVVLLPFMASFILNIIHKNHSTYHFGHKSGWGWFPQIHVIITEEFIYLSTNIFSKVIINPDKVVISGPAYNKRIYIYERKYQIELINIYYNNEKIEKMIWEINNILEAPIEEKVLK